MQIVDASGLKVFTDDHPTGALAQRYLLTGQDGTPENFMFSLAETIDRFQMLRHRHNFDQFRFVISGQMSLGDRTLREGQLAYFPEGASYGPQDDPAGPLVLVLQFGGASGNGYVSPQQYRDGRDALSKVGRFEGPVFVRELPDGTVKRTFSINAIWEQALGHKLLLPAPRYDQPVLIEPKAFRWVPVAGAPGLMRKALGTFGEREVSAEQLSIDRGAEMRLKSGEEIRLLFVLEGSGRMGSESIGRHFGMQLDPGDEAVIVAEAPLLLLSFRLPMIDPAWTEPNEASFEPLPDDGIGAQG